MKNRMFVKFCGITKPDDAISAQNAGCDALGFVFVKKSKRYINSETYRNISKNISPMILKVALFANNSDDEIEEVLRTCDIDVLQFHGHETAGFCRKWHRPYWKAVPMGDNINPLEYADQYYDASAFLVDNFSAAASGGSGMNFNWNHLPQNLGCKWILAGGLSNENIRQARVTTGLTHFDVSSGIETSPGIKSSRLMKEFIKKLND